MPGSYTMDAADFTVCDRCPAGSAAPEPAEAEGANGTAAAATAASAAARRKDFQGLRDRMGRLRLGCDGV
ncbi:hypothetical protein GCM10010284_34440 [Streptomyces rubiginosohelvolus]|uniref:Uncharacterized protein n=1 Tax=Streptomyces rubiginosohelvolus TaxID=67362 RepID=A0ABQ3BHD9_9ACTN|nr:hypothetical protein GCM10010284_34440 [Streptomyces rubiginosohelvolus]GGZ45376.1 hypothetical protein GCM10010328_19870 [Streptomyces pluricolorescens]